MARAKPADLYGQGQLDEVLRRDRDQDDDMDFTEFLRRPGKRRADDAEIEPGLHHAASRTTADVLSEREARILAIAERVDRELRYRDQRTDARRSFRGRRVPIVCLTDLDSGTGGCRIFPSATAAGARYGRCADNIIQAIVRKGTCGGHRWAYLDDLAGTLGQAADGRRVFIPDQPVDLPAARPERVAAKRTRRRPERTDITESDNTTMSKSNLVQRAETALNGTDVCADRLMATMADVISSFLSPAFKNLKDQAAHAAMVDVIDAWEDLHAAAALHAEMAEKVLAAIRKHTPPPTAPAAAAAVPPPAKPTEPTVNTNAQGELVIAADAATIEAIGLLNNLSDQISKMAVRRMQQAQKAKETARAA